VGERRRRVSRNNLLQMNDADAAAVTRQIDGEPADLHARFSLTPLKDGRRTSRTLGASWPRCRRALTRSSLPRADPDADASADRWYAWVTMRRAPGWAVMNGGDQGRILSWSRRRRRAAARQRSVAARPRSPDTRRVDFELRKQLSPSGFQC